MLDCDDAQALNSKTNRKTYFSLFSISNIMFDMLHNSDEMRMKILAKNLSRLRKERGISLTALAERAGISKSTLSSLEAGQANPTISTLWALADALEVPFGALIAESDESIEVGETGVSVRLIEQSEGEPRIEVYLMRLNPGGLREAAPHSSGVIERFFVIKGRVLAGPSNSPKLLRAGESISFKADQPHIYIAIDEPASALVTIEYPRKEAFSDVCTLSSNAPRNREE
jgi:transcriptional regulator with XRE-family HTH domain